MSRPKSPERIQADADKAIRQERLDRKRKEREAKRTIRARKRATHEHVIQNGIPKVQSGGTELGLHDAIAYSPLVFCARCGRLSRSNEFIGGLCEGCHYGKELHNA
jgi:hypothetical protein